MTAPSNTPGLTRRVKRIATLARMFRPQRIHGNFQAMDQLFDSAPVPALGTAIPLAHADAPLPPRFIFEGETLATEAFLAETETTGLLVWRDGVVTCERYAHGMGAERPHITWSVSKSLLATLFGQAIDRGEIGSIEETVDHWLPAYGRSGYRGVALKDVLQMSSGIAFDENLESFFSDLNRLARHVVLGRRLDRFGLALQRRNEPGTYHRYASLDAQILALVLISATGRTIAELTRDWLWTPLGASRDAYWLTDEHGIEFALGGFCATLPDLLRFGLLYLHGGRVGEQQLVPEAWVRAATTPDAAHLMPGPRENSSHELGYGYQWWIPAGDENEYIAMGAFNQFIYVNPTRRAVIVKTSANFRYTMATANRYENGTIALLRAIASAER